MARFSIAFAVAWLTVAAPAQAAAPASVVGHWCTTATIPNVGVLTSDMTLKEDGSFVALVTRNATERVSMSGRWTLSGDSLDYVYLSSTPQVVLPGTRDTDRVLEVSESRLVLFTVKGDTRTYLRCGLDEDFDSDVQPASARSN